MFGINWQLTDSVGSDTFLITGGKVNQLIDKISNVHPKIIRVGGNDFDRKGATPAQFARACDSIIYQLGAEPLVEIPIYRKYGTTGTFNFTPADAVFLLNSLASLGYNIKYISLGNEPDFYYDVDSTHAGIDSIASKFKQFVPVIKQSFPTIKVVGPSVTNYYATDNSPYYPANPRIIKALMGAYTGLYSNDTINGAIPGMPGLYYLDILDFHDYVGRDNSGISSSDFDRWRDTLVNYSKNQLADKFINEMYGTGGFMNRANLCRPSNKITFALTEMNVNYYNPPNSGADALTSRYKNSIYGIGCHSFLAGQHWASMYMEAMKSGNCAFITPWSIHESGGGRGSTDFGMFNNNTPGVEERSTYYHLQMLSENFNNTFCTGTVSSGQNYVRVFGSLNYAQQMVVMILNMDTTNNFNFNLRLTNSGSYSGSNPLKMKVDGGINVEYSDSIENQSTLLLTFDLGGNLIKRCKYELRGNADSTIGPTCEDKCNGSTDAYMKDFGDDSGYEPIALNPWDLYEPPDLWVRDTLENLTSSPGDPNVYAYEHQGVNPTWTNNPAEVPWVYVKVRNRGCDSIKGRIHLYYTKATLDDQWSFATDPGTGRHWSWEEIDSADVALAISENGTYAFQWDSIATEPDPLTGGDSAYCLLARFISASDAMNNEQDSIAAGYNVQANNNIIQRNVTLINGASSSGCVYVANSQATDLNVHLQFFAQEDNSLDFFDNGGHVTVELGDSLYTWWDNGGQIRSGAKSIAGTTLLDVYEPDAYIDNITFPAMTEKRMCFTFSYEPGIAGELFKFDVREFLDSSFTGAERYIITYPDCPQVDAGEDYSNGGGCDGKLAASPNLEDGEYTWIIYDGKPEVIGDTISSKSDAEIAPESTTTYQVFLRLPNGCFSSDLITVTVDEGGCGERIAVAAENESMKSAGSYLLDCVPNPSSDATVFNYSLEKDAAGEIHVVNLLGEQVGRYPLAKNSNAVRADCSEFPGGIYFYSLIVNGKTVKTKKLVITK
jgi:hypothetical protein